VSGFGNLKSLQAQLHRVRTVEHVFGPPNLSPALLRCTACRATRKARSLDGPLSAEGLCCLHRFSYNIVHLKIAVDKLGSKACSCSKNYCPKNRRQVGYNLHNLTALAYCSHQATWPLSSVALPSLTNRVTVFISVSKSAIAKSSVCRVSSLLASMKHES